MRPFKKRGGKDAHAEKNGKRANSRAKSRKQEFSNNEDSMWGAYNATSHKIRHKKKLRKFNERLSDKRRLNETDFMLRNDPYRATAVNMSRSVHEVGLPGNHSLALANLDTRFVNTTEEIVKEKVGVQNYCYTPGEVLEIIAMTCLVNFIFWFAIITCVSVASKKGKAKYAKWESVESVEIISEDDIKVHDSNHYPCCLRRSISPSEYVDGYGCDYSTLEEDDALVRRIDGRYSFSRNSCFDDGSQDWGILYTDGSDNNNWGDRPKSPGDVSYSVDHLLLV